jgi:hypothetical protein
MGVRLMNLAAGDSVVAVARNAEAGSAADEDDDEADDEGQPEAGEPPAAGPVAEASPDLTPGEPQDG